jgi:1-aminocyclopropane-1-carboxylate deaminase
MLDITQKVNAPLQQLFDPLFDKKGINVFIKREDLIHPNISGNKWRKLKHNLIDAKEKGVKTLLTFGGAYSNHIHALATAGDLLDFKTIGCIRGEEHLPLNFTLSEAQKRGMVFHYMDRSTYREKTSDTVINKLKDQFGDFYLVPEGGTNESAVKGCAEIIEEIDFTPDYIMSAIGTGGTLAGLIAGMQNQGELLGVSSLKGGVFLTDDIQRLLGNEYQNWQVLTEYHFGGYAKTDDVLFDFIKTFKRQHGLLLDPVYTSKMAFAFYDLLQKDYFKKGSSVVLIHTGGLQGWHGMIQKNRVDDTYVREVIE